MIGEDGFTYSDAHSRPLDAWLEDIRKNPLTEFGLERFNPDLMKKRLETLITVEVKPVDFLAGAAKALGLNVTRRSSAPTPMRYWARHPSTPADQERDASGSSSHRRRLTSAARSCTTRTRSRVLGRQLEVVEAGKRAVRLRLLEADHALAPGRQPSVQFQV